MILAFFVKELCGADYVHEPLLVPTQAMLDAYKKAKGRWDDYERQFLQLMAERKIETQLDRRLFARPAALLCSEPTPEHCHRRLVLEEPERVWERGAPLRYNSRDEFGRRGTTGPGGVGPHHRGALRRRGRGRCAGDRPPRRLLAGDQADAPFAVHWLAVIFSAWYCRGGRRRARHGAFGRRPWTG